MIAKIKLVFLILFGLAALAVLLLNLDEVEVHLLVARMTMPLAVLLFATLVIGFLLGLLANTLWKVQAWRAKSKADSQAKAAADASKYAPGIKPPLQ